MVDKDDDDDDEFEEEDDEDENGGGKQNLTCVMFDVVGVLGEQDMRIIGDDAFIAIVSLLMLKKQSYG